MNDAAMIELEIQQRGKAFSRALEQLERQYNCTATTVPKWLPNVSGTFVLGFDKQVLVGPVPPMPERQEEKNDETEP